MKESRIAFVGPTEYVDSLRFMGFDCFGVLSKEEAEEEIKRLEEEQYALVFVSQDICPDKTKMERVVVLPGILKTKDEKFLKEEITKAIGGEIEL